MLPKDNEPRGTDEKYPENDQLIYRNNIATILATKGSYLLYTTAEIRKDIKCVGIAVKNDGLALEHAIKKLQENEEIVNIAVQQNGLALRFASDDLKKNFITVPDLFNI